jgi:hypothetical protein
MTLPASGNPIKISQVDTELGSSSTAQLNIGASSVRNIAGVPSGAVSISNLQGKQTAGSVFYGLASSYTSNPAGGPNLTNGSWTDCKLKWLNGNWVATTQNGTRWSYSPDTDGTASSWSNYSFNSSTFGYDIIYDMEYFSSTGLYCYVGRCVSGTYNSYGIIRTSSTLNTSSAWTQTYVTKSPDGITGGTGNIEPFSAIRTIDGTNGVAVKSYQVGSNYYNRIYRTTNGGSSWSDTGVQYATSSASFYTLTSAGGRYYFVANSAGAAVMYTSTDGLSWSTVTFSDTTPLLAANAGYINSRWILAGYRYDGATGRYITTIHTSTDGITFSTSGVTTPAASIFSASRDSTTSTQGTSMVVCNGFAYLAIKGYYNSTSTNPGIWRSKDGLDWSTYSTSIPNANFAPAPGNGPNNGFSCIATNGTTKTLALTVQYSIAQYPWRGYNNNVS